MSEIIANNIGFYLLNQEKLIHLQEIIANRKSTQWEVRSQPLDNITKMPKDIAALIARSLAVGLIKPHREIENGKIQLSTISSA